MTKALSNVTHAIVRTVKSQEDMTAMKGVIAFVDICFGPEDENAINLIAIKKVPGPVSQVSAEVPKTIVISGAKSSWKPVITGKVASEAIMLALIAFDRVKSAHGLKFNKNYKVIAKEVQEVQ